MASRECSCPTAPARHSGSAAPAVGVPPPPADSRLSTIPPQPSSGAASPCSPSSGADCVGPLPPTSTRTPDTPARKGADRSLLHLGRQSPIGRPPTQLMDYYPIPFPAQLAQESPHLPRRDADLLGGLFLGDQSLLGLLQCLQPVSLGLGRQQLSFVHPPGWPLSIGHFYLAQSGDSHVAPTPAKKP